VQAEAGRTTKGDRTRRAILARAVDLASVEGLEGLTIGRLAAELGMSKSGVFAHFGSKLELQLATVGAAARVFRDEVIKPGLRVPRGLARLEALCDAWFSYEERRVFSGGCFFAAAASEFDGRPGPLRDRLAALNRDWLRVLERAAAQAQDAGELDPGEEPAQVAFELHALALGAHWAYQLFDDVAALARARRAAAARLRRAAPAGPVPAPGQEEGRWGRLSAPGQEEGRWGRLSAPGQEETS
jgi:AcrR family transcriptional regulator